MSKNDKFKFNKSGDYYKDLAMRESSCKHNAKNQLGYLGLYQMGEAALIDAGYYIKPKGYRLNNDWKGKWLGKYNINNENDFLNNIIVQEIAIREYHKIIWEKYLKDYHKDNGRIIGKIKLTQSGMIAASHLVGHGGLKEFIKSNGKKILRDGNGCLCIEYLSGFAGYEVDYSITSLQQQLGNKITATQEPIKKDNNMIKETIGKICLSVAKETLGKLCFNVAHSVCNIFTKKIFKNDDATQQVVNNSVHQIISSLQSNTDNNKLTDQQYNEIGANKAIKEIEALLNKITKLDVEEFKDDIKTLNNIKQDVSNKKFLPQDYAFFIFKVANKIDDFKKVIS